MPLNVVCGACAAAFARQERSGLDTPPAFPQARARFDLGLLVSIGGSAQCALGCSVTASVAACRRCGGERPGSGHFSVACRAVGMATTSLVACDRLASVDIAEAMGLQGSDIGLFYHRHGEASKRLS